MNRVNKYDQQCAKCGMMVRAGTGRLTQCYNDIDDRMEWLVWHKDETICQARLAKIEAEKVERRQVSDLRHAELEELIAQANATTGLGRKTDWSWDDYRFSLRNTVAETEHFEAQEYLADGMIIGYIIKDKISGRQV